MSAPKFTPGPWEYLPAESVGGCQIVPENGPSVAPNMWDVKPDDSYLMAASPTMYEALEVARDMLIANGIRPSECCFIDEVLAKARNE